MKLYLAASFAGIFVLDERNKILFKKIFIKDPEYIALKLNELESGKVSSDFFKGIPKGEYETEFPILGFKQEKNNAGSRYLQQNFRAVSIESGFVKDEEELNRIITEVNIARTKIKIASTQKKDKLIIQAVSALSDLDKILNVMSERLREWYGLHYPELSLDHEKYAEAVSKFGQRDSFPDFKKSMGMPLDEKDAEALKTYALDLKDLYATRKLIEKYLEYAVPKEMPNTNTLLGSTLAARLLAAAGSLEKLAKMPSSTIQLLGAEKALFRYLKSREKAAKAPKYGILFLHPDISSAEKEKKGKIARLLAAKLTLAIRADFYSKRDMTKELLEGYKRSLEKIKKGG